jgi:hypothetical protein
MGHDGDKNDVEEGELGKGWEKEKAKERKNEEE